MLPVTVLAWDPGTKVFWKALAMMKRFVLLAAIGAGLLLTSYCTAALVEAPNTLSAEEKQAGFELLFNGRDLKGWEQKGNWKVEGDAMSRVERGGDITYAVKPLPDDFELRFEWKVAPGSNSGLYYRAGQYEYQILDNTKHADGRNPRSSAASLYFCMAPSHDATQPVGQWNAGRILCKGTVIQHWLNGQKVIDFDYADPRWAAEVELLRQRGGDLASRGAKLHLQDHGDPVWYRGLKLRTIPAGETLERTAVVPAAIPEAAREHEREVLEKIRLRKQAPQKPRAAKG